MRAAPGNEVLRMQASKVKARSTRLLNWVFSWETELELKGRRAPKKGSKKTNKKKKLAFLFRIFDSDRNSASFICWQTTDRHNDTPGPTEISRKNQSGIFWAFATNPQYFFVGRQGCDGQTWGRAFCLKRSQISDYESAAAYTLSIFMMLSGALGSARQDHLTSVSKLSSSQPPL